MALQPGKPFTAQNEVFWKRSKARRYNSRIRISVVYPFINTLTFLGYVCIRTKVIKSLRVPTYIIYCE